MEMTPDLQPTLKGKLLLLRPLEENDWEQMYAVASDRAVWELHPVKDRYQKPVFREYFDGAISSRTAFAITDRSSGKVCGSSRYFGLDRQKDEIEIGWTFLGKAYWGGSFNAELKDLMLKHAFGIVGTVIFWVGEANVRSRRAMEKIGGILRPGVYTRPLSGDIPYVIYEITRDQWQRKQKSETA